MDANDSKFFLLSGVRDWETVDVDHVDPSGARIRRRLGDIWADSDHGSPPPGPPAALEWDDDRDTLRLRRELTLAPGSGSPLSLDERRGAATDRFGNLFLVTDDRRGITIRSSGTRRTTPFWSMDDPVCVDDEECVPADFASKSRPSAPGFVDGLAFAPDTRIVALAVTHRHYLVAVTNAPSGLLVFDLFAGGPPHAIEWRLSEDFTPFDVSPTPDGGLFVLDRDAARLWRVDHRFTPMPLGVVERQDHDFQPSRGSGVRATITCRASPTVDLATNAASAAPFDPIAVESVSDRVALVMDVGVAPARLWAVIEGRLAAPQALDVRERLSPADRIAPGAAALASQDIIFKPSPQALDGVHVGILFVPSVLRTQALAFAIRVGREGPSDVYEVIASPTSYPMRGFTGQAMVCDRGEALYHTHTGWRPLSEQRTAAFARDAAIERRFDAEVPGTVWHRVMLDGSFPSDSRVRILGRSDDDAALLSNANWVSQPAPLPRPNGIELPHLKNRGRQATLETFLHSLVGRFVDLRLEIEGTGHVSPCISALRIWYPRFSYLERYLPSVYRQDSDSRRFLEGFLGNFEGMFTEIEDEISSAQMLFDPRSAPEDALEWLASWIGLSFDPRWSPTTRRMLIDNAATFYRMRGTRRGVALALRLAFESPVDPNLFDCIDGRTEEGGIRIIEDFRIRSTPRRLLGDPLADAPTVFPLSGRWIPDQSAAALHERYRQRLGTSYQGVQYPLTPPTAQAPLWEAFSEEVLGFVPRASTDADLRVWRGMLARRYRSLARLRAVYGEGAQFETIPLHTALPSNSSALQDWYRLESVALPTVEHAHRFSVFVPIPPDLEGNATAERTTIELAKRIIDLAKPAHTIYSVDLYVALVRLGYVRLGFDTFLAEGSRAPWLSRPLEVGSTDLGAGWLAPRVESREKDRFIVGERTLEGRSI